MSLADALASLQFTFSLGKRLHTADTVVGSLCVYRLSICLCKQAKTDERTRTMFVALNN